MVEAGLQLRSVQPRPFHWLLQPGKEGPVSQESIRAPCDFCDCLDMESKGWRGVKDEVQAPAQGEWVQERQEGWEPLEKHELEAAEYLGVAPRSNLKRKIWKLLTNTVMWEDELTGVSLYSGWKLEAAHRDPTPQEMSTKGQMGNKDNMKSAKEGRSCFGKVPSAVEGSERWKLKLTEFRKQQARQEQKRSRQ